MPYGLTPDGWVVYYAYNFETGPCYTAHQNGEMLIFLNYNTAVQGVESTLQGMAWDGVPIPQYMWIGPHYGMWNDGVRIN